MKKILLSFVLCFSVFTWASSQLDSARYLAEQDIIVNQSTQAQEYRINTSLEIQEAAMYRLSDSLTRQETLGTIVKMANLYLPPSYSCRKYFIDTPEWWVCRAAEVSADNGIVSRNNTKFRPRDTLTLAESLGLMVKALNIQLSITSTSTISGSLPDWQKRIILTLREQNIGYVQETRPRTPYGDIMYNFYWDGYDGRGTGLDFSHRLTRGEFFQLAVLFLTRDNGGEISCENYRYSNCPTGCDAVCVSSSCSGDMCTDDCEGPNSCRQKPFSFAGCKTYNDGCNECSVSGGDAIACTERVCIWQGTPSCSSCEIGYVLSGKRCIPSPNSCVREGGYAGGGMVIDDESYSGYVCCSGLTRAERADGTTFADAGYTCIRQGDNYCDSRYENSYNSSDCRTTACVQEGGEVGNYSVAPEYQNIGTCCSGLTSVGPKDLVVGGSNICANIGDGYCDSRYESTLNSYDCVTTTFDSSICQNYFDGCNNCSRQSNGQTICTMMACFTNGPAYCTSYVSYSPINQSQDDTYLNNVLNEIRNYTKDLSCTNHSQCDWKLFGRNPCGSSSIGIKYSSKNIDMTLFESKTNFYTSAQALYNQTYPTFGTCAMMSPPPSLSCINNVCTYGGEAL